MDRKPATHQAERAPAGHQPRRRYFLAEPLRVPAAGLDVAAATQAGPADTRPLDVLLLRAGQRTPVAGVRDISLDGIYVYMEAGTARIGQVVDLILVIDNNGRRAEHRVAATVHRVDNQGAALLFSDYTDKLYSDLVALLCAN